MIRFFVLFFVIMMALFTVELLPLGQQYFVTPLTSGLAAVSGVLIDLLGRDVLTQGVIIYDLNARFAIEIAAGCNGVEAMILLTAAILAFPSPWKHKLIGIALGWIAIQGLNLVRIVSLFFLGLWNETAFEWAHLYLWQALIMLDALVVWLLWIRALPAREATSEVAA
ncbi:exosortase H [Proteus terrae]|uniref:exosortase H n=1 Tax=Proteus terrae TaxID=1574161 RepID=UPI001BA4BD4F|nr:exosortase H [Proteus terrae]MCK9506756.1 exosortase H [Porticoccaceae bacterium]QUT01352.1 exosortase H [Proteus terrae subsp. cibarius]QZD36656.1 exosortase H [Proteus terrae subsp. cibarius]